MEESTIGGIAFVLFIQYTSSFFVTFVSYQSQTETFVGIELDQKCLSDRFSKWTQVSSLNRVRGLKQESIYIHITTSCLSTST